MSEPLQIIVPTEPKQTMALLRWLNVAHQGNLYGCECYIGISPKCSGAFGLVFPNHRDRRSRSREQEVAFVLRYLGVPVRDLGLLEIPGAWATLKPTIRRAIDRVGRVISTGYVDRDASSLEDAWIEAVLESM